MSLKSNFINLVLVGSGVYLGLPIILLSVELFRQGDTIRAIIIGSAGIAVVFLPQYIRTQLPSLRKLLTNGLKSAIPGRLSKKKNLKTDPKTNRDIDTGKYAQSDDESAE